MAEQETFELSDGTAAVIYGTNWGMQSWTTTSAYTITAVALYCLKDGSPGDITVSIREVDSETGKPTGIDKCSVTVAEGVISNFPTRAWYTFTFDTSYALDDATQYAIVMRATGGSAFNAFWPFGYGSSGYADGGFSLSTNSSSSWGTISTTNDMDFRIYGGTPSPGLPTTPSPVNTGTGITLDETPFSWVSGGDTDTYEIYFRESGDAWPTEPNGVAQAGVTWAINFGTIAYGTTYEWRVDATNPYDTTTGTTWSFGSIAFDQLRISYVLISGGSGAGPYDDPPGTEGTDWSWTGLNNMITVRRLVVAANSKIWYESI